MNNFILLKKVFADLNSSVQQTAAARSRRRGLIAPVTAALFCHADRCQSQSRFLCLDSCQLVFGSGDGGGHARGFGARIAGRRLLETHHEVNHNFLLSVVLTLFISFN